jgi:hypothetical protein
MTETQLKTLVDETIEWANDLAETWTGTTMGNIINNQNNHLKDLVSQGEMNLASVAVLELAQTCDYAEKEGEHE